jgi:hypothetical protein
MYSNGNSFGVSMGECPCSYGGWTGIPISIVAKVASPASGRK